MVRRIPILPLLFISLFAIGQQKSLDQMLSDSTMLHASVSLCIINAGTGETLIDHNGSKSFSQASVMKLVTTAAAVEMLGPGYTFTTTIGYSGIIKKGVLGGDIIIKGGGDPTLGSERFAEHYTGFMDKWVEEIRKAGIRKITGRVITDDSYYDYQPVPPNWNWEDLGNYYGAGVYGLSIFDNTLKIHFSTGDSGTVPVITSSDPVNPGTEYVNHLMASGTSDQGYVYSAPYNSYGWISGTIPPNRPDFVLKASLTDPPLLAAALLSSKLSLAEVKISGKPSTSRILAEKRGITVTEITTTQSPPLSDIIEVLNHESVNLYAEHLVKELGKIYNDEGSTSAGTVVIKGFLDSLGVGSSGMFIEDGSGLSPQDAVNSKGLATLLYQMKKNGKYFAGYYNSLPEAGKTGTLKNVFRDPAFEGMMRAKSGTILRVKSYAGYLTAKSGNEMTFSIIVNNYTGSSTKLVADIANILKETILEN